MKSGPQNSALRVPLGIVHLQLCSHKSHFLLSWWQGNKLQSKERRAMRKPSAGAAFNQLRACRCVLRLKDCLGRKTSVAHYNPATHHSAFAGQCEQAYAYPSCGLPANQ